MGAKGWRSAAQDAVGMNGIRIPGPAKQVQPPRQVKTYDEVIAALERWSSLVKKYDEVTECPMPDAGNIIAFNRILPVKLEEDPARQKGNDTV